MVDLIPAPSSLALASPALGAWFGDADGNIPAALALPNADLSVPLTFARAMQWRAPAGCTASFFIADAPRPAAIAHLRQADGNVAFADGDVLVLLTLLPEVELRLEALTAIIPSPDGVAPAVNTPTRPRLRYLALSFDGSAVSGINAIEQLRPSDLPPSLDAEGKANYLGLTLDEGMLKSAAHPTSELHRPATDSAAILQNRTGSDLQATLWAFDFLGHPVDPGAVATWWSHLASDGIFDNLWADSDESEQRTATASPGFVVHLSAANEGPISPDHLARLTPTGLTLISGATSLFTANNNAALSLDDAEDPDNMPVPRIALLPHGNYVDPTSPNFTLFAGWRNATTWPATLPRDFARVGVTDFEQTLTGLTRNDALQSASTTRIAASENTAANPVVTQSDTGHVAVMTSLINSDAAVVMSPVMDGHWGPLVPTGFGVSRLPDWLVFDVKPLRGEGNDDGTTASEQKVLVYFPATDPPIDPSAENTALPAGGWIRLWPHGLDTQTGQRFRQDGGGALIDTTGRAFVVMSIPDGKAAPTALDVGPVRLSFDALVVTDAGARYFTEQRYNRPAVLAGDRIRLDAPPVIPNNTTLWLSEPGATMPRGGQSYGSGMTLIGVPDDLDNGDYALVDLTSLDSSDIAPTTLTRAATNGDTLITTTPAFGSTAPGDIAVTGDQPAGSTLVHRDRAGLLDSVTEFGRPVPTQECRELAAADADGTVGATGFVGATPGRSSHHEFPPARQGHPGMPASSEVHGTGVTLGGAAVTPLGNALRERSVTSFNEFISLAQQPVPTSPSGTAATHTYTALLETLTYGVSGDAAVRGFVDLNPDFTPGQSWLNIKAAIEATGINIDPLIDTATFDEDALAAAIDRVIVKARDGAHQFATALQAAVGRAEDFIYLETPAIDALQAGTGGVVNLVGAITDRWLARPALKAILCVPEKHLPGDPEKLDAIRSAGVSSAYQTLRAASPDNIELFTPIAGSARRLHMASTTAVIDDVVLFAGSTHCWRRGLSFDASLAVGLIDEAVASGRPAAVRAARRQLFVDRLGLANGLIPDDPADMIDAVRRLNARGGFLRVKPDAYPPIADVTVDSELQAWNPDGLEGGVGDWFVFFAGVDAAVQDELNNAVR